MHAMPKCFMWKERCGFSNGLGFLDNLLVEWKDIRKKSQIVTRKVVVIMNEGHYPKGRRKKSKPKHLNGCK